MTPKEIKLIKNLKNVKWFKKLGYGNTADIVHCPHCDSNMLIPTGATYCPICAEEVQWVEELEKEGIYDCNLEEFCEHNEVEITEPQCWRIWEDENRYGA